MQKAKTQLEIFGCNRMAGSKGCSTKEFCAARTGNYRLKKSCLNYLKKTHPSVTLLVRDHKLFFFTGRISTSDKLFPGFEII
jgi:hypothetical protein